VIELSRRRIKKLKRTELLVRRKEQCFIDEWDCCHLGNKKTRRDFILISLFEDLGSLSFYILKGL
jgi:hypothetical protein